MNNDPKVAQWYLEAGTDDLQTGVLMTILCIMGAWLVLPALLIPWFIYLAIRGLVRRHTGKKMNREAGRPNVERHFAHWSDAARWSALAGSRRVPDSMPSGPGLRPS